LESPDPERLTGDDYLHFFEQGPEAVFLTDPETLRVRDVNDSFLTLLGYSSRSEIVGQSVLLFSSSTENQIRKAIDGMKRTRERPARFQRTFRRADGIRLPVELLCSFSRFPGGGDLLIGHVRELTREREMEKLNSVYVELDRRILAGQDLETLLSVIVDRLVTGFGFALAYISLPEPDGTIRYLNIRSDDPSCAQSLEEESRPFKWNEPPGNRRLSARVLESRQPAFVLTEEAKGSPLFDWYRKQGIDASLVIPLLGEDSGQPPWGTLTMSVRNRQAFPDSRRQLFLEFSDRLRVAFSHYAEHHRIRLFRGAMESGRAPSLLVNPDGTIAWSNRAFSEMTRTDLSRIMGESLRQFFPLSDWGKGDGESVLGFSEEEYSGEWCGMTADGTAFLAEVLVSPIRNDRLSLTHFLVHMKDVTSEREKEREIHRLAHHDPLTGLLNRNGFLKLFRQETEMSSLTKKRLALGFLDLDGFKELNDTLGHAAGDRFLETVSRRMSEAMEGKGTLGRLGGDEFVILVRESDDLIFERLFTHLLEQVSRPVAFKEGQFQTTVSVGVAIYPDDGQTVEELLRKADLTMYHAKSAGKNTVRFFEESIEQGVRETYEKGTALRQAIARKEFELYFQPQVDVRNNRLVGVEALIRWNRPDRGMILPASFIPLAEETGLIHSVGDWVLEEALSLLEKWDRSDFPPFRLAVNVSARQFRSESFWSDLESRFDRYPSSASRLSLELTESLFMGDSGVSPGRIASLRKQGVTFVIDDFGTGYSSLSYLTRLPVDSVKIPQEFVLRMRENDRDRKMVEIIAHMARSLDLFLIGEGAESPVEIEMLRELGCFVVQGFCISRPLSLPRFEAYLDKIHSGRSRMEFLPDGGPKDSGTGEEAYLE
jgi:diguanylate cyclase (GGDEF)-like protein/PAS domain S-box-containing protein